MSTLCPNSCRQTARIGGGSCPPPCPPPPPSRTTMVMYDVEGPVHVNLNKTVFYVSEVNIVLLSPTCMFMAYQYTSGHYLPVDMPFYYVIPFTMYAVIVQRPTIDTVCMSEAVMQLVAGTLCYENVVMHIMRMVFHANVESHNLMPG